MWLPLLVPSSMFVLYLLKNKINGECLWLVLLPTLKSQV